MRFWKVLLPLLASSLCLAAQPDRIPGIINSSQMVALPGQVHPLAQSQYDQGAVEPTLPLNYVTLTIAPSPTQQAALEQLLAQQQDRSSPYYHKWLTPEQYADRFGLSQNDVNKISAWLRAQGFFVIRVARGRNSVIFSGTAAQVQGAFATKVHRYYVNGEMHIANSTSLSIPAALKGVVTGVRGLHDFRPKPMNVRAVQGKESGKERGPHPSYTTTINSNAAYFIAPGDIATLYNINSLYNAATAIDGTGQKLAIVGQTDIYLADLADFRSGFGLPSYNCTTAATGLITSCNTSNFMYVLLGTDPGKPSLGDLFESDLDVEWAGAVARNAQIIFINAETSGGVNDALSNAIDNQLAPVISMSYGECEQFAGSLEAELQQANTEGITIMNSSGDRGSAECDFDPPGGSHAKPPFAAADGGLAASYPASSPEVTSVGGTAIPSADFDPAFWSATNGTDGGSALPTLVGQEVPWNDDEALAEFCLAHPTNSFCRPSPGVPVTSAQTFQEDYWISIGGGGVSNCFNPTFASVCSSGFARPAWQQAITIPGLTSPQSTYRLVPDVSLLASPNFPGYILCTPREEVSNTTSSTSTCDPGGAAGIATAVDTYFSLVGGTSASAPVFAGIVTLLNQYLGATGLGNVNSTLYALAATPSNGVFHPVTTGDNDVYCQVNTPAGQPSDVICPAAGIIGFDGSTADATTGYNLVTGLGSVDAFELAQAWSASRTTTTTALSTSATSVNQNVSVTFTATVTPSTATGTVSFFNNGSTTALGTAKLSNGTATFSTTALPPGTDNVTATYDGDATDNVSTSAAVTVTVTQATFTLASANGVTFPVAAGGTASVQLTINSSNGFIDGSNNTTILPLTYTCTGVPALPAAEISCQLPNGGQPTFATAVTINLVTTPVTTQLQRPTLSRSSPILYALLLPGVFGLVLAAGSRARAVRLLSLIVVLGCSTVWLGACGGSSNNNTSLKNAGTPPGQYVVTITASNTTGGVTISNSNAPFTITLTVTQ